jgi:hypothetical protein
MNLRSTNGDESPITAAFEIASNTPSNSLPEGAAENSPGQAARSPGNAVQFGPPRPVVATEFPQISFGGATRP